VDTGISHLTASAIAAENAEENCPEEVNSPLAGVEEPIIDHIDARQ